MEKCQLPVIVLKDLILLPYNELRLELDAFLGSQIEKALDLINENHVFVVTKKNPLEESTSLEDMPEVGTVAKIESKLELPNGKYRMVLSGLTRAECKEYSYTFSKVIQGEIIDIFDKPVESELNIAITRKLKKELDSYMKEVPNISNSVIAKIDSATNIEKITDIIVQCLPLSIARKRQYLECLDPLKRTEMILGDIYQEEALVEIEKRIDNKVKKTLENSQKDYFLREKIRYIQEELGDSSIHEQEIQELNTLLNGLVCKPEVKEKIAFEIGRYESLPPTSPEMGMMRTYLDYLLHLPWDKRTLDKENLREVKKSLDASHYGLDQVKMRIMEYLAVQKHSQNLSGPILCFVGPPGTGKTTLARSIAKSMGRNLLKFLLVVWMMKQKSSGIENRI